MAGLSSPRIGAAVFVFGFFVAAAPVPFLTGSHPWFGILRNLETLTVTIREPVTVPYFAPMSSGYEDGRYQKVTYTHSSGKEVLILFQPGTPVDEMTRIMRAAVAENGPLSRPNYPGERLRFEEWVTDRPGFSIAYKYFLFAGLLISFGGILFVLLRTSRGV